MSRAWIPFALLLARTVAAQPAETSTKAVMPEEGGALPRAPMPTGGAGDGIPRSGKTGGVDDGMGRSGQVGGAHIGQHCHEHDHDGEAHDHCHDHAGGPEHRHQHEGEPHCHDHEHDGEKHDHCHDHAATPLHDHDHAEEGHPHDHDDEPDEHCHEHTHADGTSHTHCHQEKGDPEHSHDHGMAEGLALGVKTKAGIELAWDGFLRVIAEVIENDPRSTFIGRNDGFKLGQVRLGTRVLYEDLSAYISIEAAVGDRESFNDPNQEFTVRPRDAYMRYDFSKYAGVQLGRFKTPYDLGQLESEASRIFIDAPVESRGVLPTQGNELEGLLQDRQLGVMISKDRIGLTDGGFDIGYALALTNGRTFNLALNDNDRPAGFARIMLYYGEYIALNLAGFTDGRTVGELPNLFDEEILGGEISLSATFYGLHLEGQFLVQNKKFDTTDRPDVLSYGAHGQFDYELWGFRFGYRFAWYEPNTADLDGADQIQEHTVALAYTVPIFPVRVALAGTVALEQEGRRVENNRIALLTQFKF
jgi:hypothetical protein